MLSRSGRGRRGWVLDRPRRQADRLSFSLEVLEPRLLMAGSLLSSVDWHQSPLSPVRSDGAPTSAVGVAEYAPRTTGANPTLVDDSPAPAYVGGPPSSAPYVVVPETSAFHGTISSAQAIPNVPYAGVDGIFGPGESIDLYRVELGQGTLALRLATGYDQSSSAAQLRLWVFDRLGQVIALAATANGMVDLSIVAGRSELGAGSPVFIGVDASDSAGGSTGADYQLWFLRLPGTETLLNDSGGEIAAVPGESIGPLGVVPSASIAAPGGAASSKGAALPSGLAPLAPAQSPALAAAPSGGVLTDGGTAFEVAMATPRTNDVPKTTVPTRADARSPQASEDRLADGSETMTSSLLVTLRGPGGSPMLAGTAVGDWQSESDEPAGPLAQERPLVPGCGAAPPQRPKTALPMMLAVAAAPPEVNDLSERAASSCSIGYATLATAYTLSVDPAQIIDMLGRRPITKRTWLRNWWSRKRRTPARRH